MTRRYKSTRRKQAAEETRRSILEAALRLHWEGITGYGPLAREAGCSEPTVRKHFPTKEDLFQNCTRTFAETLTLPDLGALGRISSSSKRLEKSVTEICRIHEAMFGYAWLGAHLRTDSPTLDREMSAYEGLAGAMVEVIAPEDPTRSPVLRGLLDFLTYRAFRLSGGMSPEQARGELIATVRPFVLNETRINPPKRKRNQES